MHRILVIALATIAVFDLAVAETISAASCSQSDVQAAIDSASDGDTVFVPAGTCIWRTVASRTPAVSIIEKAITLRGAGVNRTIIRDATATNWKETALWIVGKRGKPFRITGFTFNLATSSNDWHGVIKIRGDCRNFRIDHCAFDGLTYRGVTIEGHTYGVIDHCTFTDLQAQAFAITGDNDNSWTRGLSLGTTNAVYIEDCIFDFTTTHIDAMDSFGGARFVFRFNTAINGGIQTHGVCNSNMRSVHSYEVYNNSFMADSPIFRAIYLRGGTGVVYGNTFSSNYSKSIDTSNFRSCNDQCQQWWDRCDGDSPNDGNSNETGYPCLDQIGRSTGQNSEPLYEWDNNISNGGGNAEITVHGVPGCVSPSVEDHIIANRDYHNNMQRPGYTPQTYPHPLTLELLPPFPPDNLRINSDPPLPLLAVGMTSKVQLVNLSDIEAKDVLLFFFPEEAPPKPNDALVELAGEMLREALLAPKAIDLVSPPSWTRINCARIIYESVRRSIAEKHRSRYWLLKNNVVD